MEFKKTVTIAITGASGAAYGLRLLEQLIKSGCRIFLMISQTAQVVLETEEGLQVSGSAAETALFLSKRLSAWQGQLKVFEKEQWAAPVASGSGAPRQMVVCPCSTGMLSAIAAGASNNLIERAADVVLKEQGRLIVVPRETPLSSIHIENMLKLSRLGVTILPANPGFYNKPKTINDLVDSVVARILDHLDIAHQLTIPWGSE